jgi:competence protein ComEC
MSERHGTGLGDRGAVVVALAAAAGAWWAVPVPGWGAAAAVVLALVRRRTATVALAVALGAAFLAARSWAGDRPLPAGPFRGRVTLVSDPRDVAGAEVADVRSGRHHYELWARAEAGARLASAAAGESVWVDGQQSPRRSGDQIAARRHVVASISARELGPFDPGSTLARATNALRRVVLAGGDVLPRDRRALYDGFVLGDDRGEDAVLASDFQASGLTHLLVVSGENVAFVLAVAAPALRRLGPGTRWAATVGLLAAFASVTRFEPSVLRATVMAGLAASAWTTGRVASATRVLAYTVTLLVLIDPLLVGVTGFQLSVAASAGILWLSRPLAEHLPLPRQVRGPASVTVAAQLAVAPLLLALAGGVPVAALPANLLAEPAAAVLMGWGLTAGVVAGWIGGAPARLLQWPADVLTWWVATVARLGAMAPLGALTAGLVAAGTAAGTLAVLSSRQGRRRLANVAWLVVLVVLGLPAARLAMATRPARADVGPAAELSIGDPGVVLVVRSGARLDRILGGLDRLGLRRIDLVVRTSSSSQLTDLVGRLRTRVTIGSEWAPERADDPSARDATRAPPAGTTVAVGSLRVTVERASPKLEVTVGRPEGPGVGSVGAGLARSPPLRRNRPGAGDGHPQPHARLVLRPGQLLRLRPLPGQGR